MHYTFCFINHYSLLYCYYTHPGSLADTADFIFRNFHILVQAVEGCGSGSEPLVLAEYALETGALDHVSINACKAIYESRLHRQVCIELCATFALCRLAMVQSRAAEADRLLTQLATTVEAEHNSVLNTTLTVCTAYLDCCLGRTDRVPAWLRERDQGARLLHVPAAGLPRYRHLLHRHAGKAICSAGSLLQRL